MNVRRGDVVLVLYPLASGLGASRRPALIVQNDRDNRRLANTIMAQITTNLRHANKPTHLLLAQATVEYQQAGRQDLPKATAHLTAVETTATTRLPTPHSP